MTTEIEITPEQGKDRFSFIRDLVKNFPGDAVRISRQEILTNRPNRCRVLLFSMDDNSVALMGRQRGGDSYIVLPGGGVEDYDSDPTMTVVRELLEEFSIDPVDIDIYGNEALELEPGVWVFLAKTNKENVELRLGSPESERNGTPESGYYQPEWFSLDRVSSENIVPTEFKEKMLQALEHGSTSKKTS